MHCVGVGGATFAGTKYLVPGTTVCSRYLVPAPGVAGFSYQVLVASLLCVMLIQLVWCLYQVRNRQ